MAKTAWIFSYKLKKNVSDEQFIESTKKLHDEVISKNKRIYLMGTLPAGKRVDGLCSLGN